MDNETPPPHSNDTLRRLLLLGGIFIAAWVIAYALKPYGPITPVRVAVLAVLIYVCGYLYGRTRSSILSGLTALVFFTAYILVSCYLIQVTGPSDNSEADRAAKRLSVRQQVEEDARKRLTTVGWTDPAKGLARIPLTEAMMIEIAELKKKPVHAAYAIVVAAPVPPPPVAPSGAKSGPALNPNAPKPPAPAPSSGAIPGQNVQPLAPASSAKATAQVPASNKGDSRPQEPIPPSGTSNPPPPAPTRGGTTVQQVPGGMTPVEPTPTPKSPANPQPSTTP